MVQSGYRVLVVMRHAKTEEAVNGDRLRELTARGRSDAEAAGRWLAEQDLQIELVLTSPARRALATAELVVAQLADEPELRVVEELYGASAEEVLRLVAAVEEDKRSVLVVGHNPTMEEVGHVLPGGMPDPSADQLPTAGIVVLSLDADWTRLAAGSAELVQRHVGRG